MKFLKHPVASLILFAVIVSLFVGIYTGLEDNYSVVSQDDKTLTVNGTTQTGTIMTQMKQMNLIEGVSEIDASLQKLSAGGASLVDIVGALGGVALGALKTIAGLLTAPYTIVKIILGYYAGELPGIIGGLVSIISVYVAFILLGAYLGREI